LDCQKKKRIAEEKAVIGDPNSTSTIVVGACVSLLECWQHLYKAETISPRTVWWIAGVAVKVTAEGVQVQDVGREVSKATPHMFRPAGEEMKP
jgi:hypothetical protein